MNNSGVVHFVAENDDDALYICRRLLSFLPSNNLEDPPRLDHNLPLEADPELDEIIPATDKQAYDVRSIITKIVDHNDFMEVQPGFAPNLVIGFARMQGRTVGIVANQPCVLAGALDINASDNALAHEATIRTMRRGFARVLGHQTIIDILTNGDKMHDDAVRERERRKSSAHVTATR